MNPAAPPVSWYLRSMGDRDTHRGQWSGTTRSVHSLCGLEFAPVALPYGGFFLPGTPPDPDQICSQCGTARVPCR